MSTEDISRKFIDAGFNKNLVPESNLQLSNSNMINTRETPSTLTDFTTTKMSAEDFLKKHISARGNFNGIKTAPGHNTNIVATIDGETGNLSILEHDSIGGTRKIGINDLLCSQIAFKSSIPLHQCV